MKDGMGSQKESIHALALFVVFCVFFFFLGGGEGKEVVVLFVLGGGRPTHITPQFQALLAP